MKDGCSSEATQRSSVDGVSPLGLLLYTVPSHCGIRQAFQGDVEEADPWSTFQKNSCNFISAVACVRKPVRIHRVMY